MYEELIFLLPLALMIFGAIWVKKNPFSDTNKDAKK
jgi:hypothetical protein